MTHFAWTFVRLAFCLPLAAALVCQVGCVTYAHHAVPANRLPAALLGPIKSEGAPVNLALLRQEPPPQYLLGPGDTLGVYVQGVIPPKVDEIPPVMLPQGAVQNNYYPPAGLVNTPTMGVPIEIGADGVVQLPLIEALTLTGMSLDQAAEEIRRAYLNQNIVQMGRDRIQVTLIRPRVSRILVIREDSPGEIPQMMRKDTVVFTKRGSAQIVDLPAFENDVLHALTASGGLPGVDALNQVWVLRTERDTAQMDTTRLEVESGREPQKVLEELKTHATAVRIPLRHCIDEPLPFGPEDIILNDGDIVFLEPRIYDVFYTGGLLPGGELPLPRDRDLDVVEAIAYAQGSIGGPGGVSGTAVFRSGAGPGNIIPPTRVLILRKLPNGEQLPIRVDLSRAMRDSKERIVIQPGDVVLLHYKPGELLGNVALNFLNFNVILDPSS